MSGERIKKTIPETGTKQWRPGIYHAPESAKPAAERNSSQDEILANLKDIIAKLEAQQGSNRESKIDDKRPLTMREDLGAEHGGKPLTMREDLGAEDDASSLEDKTRRENARRVLLDKLGRNEKEKDTSGKTEPAVEDTKTPEAEKSELGPSLIDHTLPEEDRRILRLALTTRGPEAMQGMQDALKGKYAPYTDPKTGRVFKSPYKRNKKVTSDKSHEAALPFAERMYQSEKDYFTALKKYQRERGFGGLLLSKFNRGPGKLPPEVQALKDKWVESRAGYANHMNSTALERHFAKNTGIEKDKRGLSVLDRYQRRFVTKEMMLGAEEAEDRARMEGLNSRDKKGLEKLFDSYSKWPKPARVLTSAIMMGVGGTAMAGLFGGAIGVVGAVGVVMSVPAGLFAITSMLQKNPDARDRLANIAGGFGLISAGGILGGLAEVTTRGIHKLFGTRGRAEATLAKKEGVGNLGDTANLKNVSKKRQKAVRAEEIIDADARLARTIAAVGGTAVLGGAVNHEIAGGAIHHGVIHGAPIPQHLPPHAPPPHVEAPRPHGVIDHLSIGDHIHHANINDGQRLLGHAAEKFRLNDFPNGQEPASLHRLNELLQAEKHQSFISSQGENNAAIKLGFEGPDGSTVVQPHDTLNLQYDAQGHLELVLTRPDSHIPPHVLFDGSGQEHPLDKAVWHQMPVHHQAPIQHEAQTDHDTSATDSYARPAEPLPYKEVGAHFSGSSGTIHTAAQMEHPPMQTTEIPVHQAEVVKSSDLLPEFSPTIPGQAAEVIASSGGEHLKASIDTLTHSNNWSGFSHAYATSVYNNPPVNTSAEGIANAPSQALLRGRLLDIIQESGVTPTADQSVGEYIQAVTKNISQ